MINTGFEMVCDDFHEMFQEALMEAGITAAAIHDGNSQYSYFKPVKTVGLDVAGKLADIQREALKHMAKDIAAQVKQATARPEFFRLTPLGPITQQVSCTVSCDTQPQASLRLTYRDSDQILRVECAFAEAA